MLLAILSPHRPCRWVKLEQHQQPTGCTKEQLASLLHDREEKPVLKRSSRSLKARLMVKEITVRQAIVELANYFPSLRNLKLQTGAWDAEALDRKAAKLSSGERAAVQFVLRVWNRHQEWQCGEFNVVEALDLWDSNHREAFLHWANDPWWV